MKPIAIIAAGVVSPLGEGAAGYAVGGLGARPETRIGPDRELTEAGLRRPNAARAALAAPTGDRAQALLDRALSLLLVDLERARPRHLPYTRLGRGRPTKANSTCLIKNPQGFLLGGFSFIVCLLVSNQGYRLFSYGLPCQLSLRLASLLTK